MIELLAQVAIRKRSLTAAHKWFSRSDPEAVEQIIIFLIFVGAGLFVGWILLQWQLRRAEPAKQQPMLLFRKLQRRLGLSLLERWRLWRLAATLKLPHPAALLISAQTFDGAVQKYTGKRARSHIFDRIRAKLFRS